MTPGKTGKCECCATKHGFLFTAAQGIRSWHRLNDLIGADTVETDTGGVRSVKALSPRVRVSPHTVVGRTRLLAGNQPGWEASGPIDLLGNSVLNGTPGGCPPLGVRA